MAQDKAQHQIRPRPAGGGDDAAAAGQAQARPASQDAGLDSLLDEIDAVLESNAEEFVKGFVQKGGQ
ncbi:ubiquitin-like protein Pup [Micrococcus sp. M4NT]|uniref:ubiquitin-like protein Pup n=1 Tax=Micrococcus sp. M4NT TaxID=2957501 RepID=UPI0029A9D370|nr:ubiquitin-like protein Pup [Micrococcus sp. M4NT]MDX2340471.1 ubiquitin-like protein Pup [Micrococcus sp. M4NT]